MAEEENEEVWRPLGYNKIMINWNNDFRMRTKK